MASSRRWHRALIVSEVALSIVPLVAAGLMLRTFANLSAAPLGFDPAGIVTARVPLSLAAYRTLEARSGFYREAAARVRGLPGVEAAAVGGPPPFGAVQSTQRYWARDNPESTPAIAVQQIVMPGYFHAMGIGLRAGRDISDDDIAHERRVVVVDERIARRLWRDRALGQRLAIGEKQTLEVVGVAASIRTASVRDQVTPAIYVPYPIYEIEETLVVRTQMPIATIAPAIKQAIDGLAPGRPVSHIRPLTDIIAASIDDTRFTMILLSGFAAAALLLATVGLYGTLAYLVSQRTQEFGVRLALGASAGGLLRLVLREGALLTGIGAALGLITAALASRALAGLLFGVDAIDAATFAGVIGLVAAVAMAAVVRPAWRASRVDPVTALRAD